MRRLFWASYFSILSIGAGFILIIACTGCIAVPVFTIGSALVGSYLDNKKAEAEALEIFLTNVEPMFRADEGLFVHERNGDVEFMIPFPMEIR